MKAYKAVESEKNIKTRKKQKPELLLEIFSDSDIETEKENKLILFEISKEGEDWC